MTMHKPEHPPLTVDAIIAWLETAVERFGPDQTYVWQDPTYCLVGHYLRDHGSQWGDAIYSDLPDYDYIAGKKPWTYGKALERAKVLTLPAAEVLPLSLSETERITDGRIADTLPQDRSGDRGDRQALGRETIPALPAPDSKAST